MAGQQDAVTRQKSTPKATRTSAQKSAHKSAEASSFVIDVMRLRRSPGAMVSVVDEIATPIRLGLDMIAIPQGSPLQRTLRLESVSEGILVTGAVSGSAIGECARCLVQLIEPVEVELTELFVYPDSDSDRTTDDDELPRVIDDTVNLDQAMIDAVGLVLPFAPRCRPDCPGLCPECGVALVEAEPGHRHDRIDPRWAKLTDIVGDLGERES